MTDPLLVDLSTYTHPAGHRGIGWGKDPFLTPGDLIALIDGLYTGYLQVVPADPLAGRPSRPVAEFLDRAEAAR